MADVSVTVYFFTAEEHLDVMVLTVPPPGNGSHGDCSRAGHLVPNSIERKAS